MEEWNINNGILKYDDETHTYWFNDKKCISVTQVVHALFPDKYKDIDAEILKKAANRGNIVHNAIECYEELGLENDDIQEFRDYKFLKNYYQFSILAVEKPIVIIYKDLVICGRFDGILEEPINGTCLYDIKTTSTLDKNYLSKQLSLYEYGVKQCYPQYEIKGLRAIHVRKGVRKYVIVDKSDAEEILDFYIEKMKEEKLIND